MRVESAKSNATGAVSAALSSGARGDKTVFGDRLSDNRVATFVALHTQQEKLWVRSLLADEPDTTVVAGHSIFIGGLFSFHSRVPHALQAPVIMNNKIVNIDSVGEWSTMIAFLTIAEFGGIQSDGYSGDAAVTPASPIIRTTSTKRLR
jgi:hypothetical protein